MKIIISNSVKTGTRKYFNSLIRGKYRLSRESAERKYKNMINGVINAAQNAKTYQVCMYKVLGQTFDIDGNPKKLNLRKFTYTDKQSGSKWVFSFLIDNEHDEVTVYKMCHSSKVINEEHDGASIRRVTESEFRQIVKGEVVKLLSKLIK